MLDLLTILDTQVIEGVDESLLTKESHEIILKRNVKLGLTHVTLTSGTSSKLIIYTPGLMALGTYDL